MANLRPLIIIHRVNTLEKLHRVSKGCGVEIDVRGYGDRMLLHHDPISDPAQCIDLENFLIEMNAEGKVSFVVFNMKEAGYEKKVIDMAARFGLSKEQYFLLDVEFPYLYRATRLEGVREIAVRYSEAEPIEAVEAQIVDGKPLLDWVWIDTNTKLPLDEQVVRRLKPFKTCLVSPDRWGRPEDIDQCAASISSFGMKLDAVMTDEVHVEKWAALLG